MIEEIADLLSSGVPVTRTSKKMEKKAKWHQTRQKKKCSLQVVLIVEHKLLQYHHEIQTHHLALHRIHLAAVQLKLVVALI